MSNNGPFYQQQTSATPQNQYQRQTYQSIEPYSQNSFYSNNHPQRGNYQLPGINNSNPGSTVNYLSSSVPIPGRVITSVDEIKPNEVPMDSSVSLFPMSDYSAIYAKQWTQNGLIATVRYIPEQSDAQSQDPSDDISSRIMQRLDDIERKLDQRSYYKPYSNNRKKGKSNVNSDATKEGA